MAICPEHPDGPVTLAGHCGWCGLNLYPLGVCEWCQIGAVETVADVHGDGLLMAVCGSCLTA